VCVCRARARGAGSCGGEMRCEPLLTPIGSHCYRGDANHHSFPNTVLYHHHPFASAPSPLLVTLLHSTRTRGARLLGQGGGAPRSCDTAILATRMGCTCPSALRLARMARSTRCRCAFTLAALLAIATSKVLNPDPTGPLPALRTARWSLTSSTASALSSSATSLRHREWAASPRCSSSMATRAAGTMAASCT
jgi:hypothetical protein